MAEAAITRQLKAYVPPEFSANLTVHFVFGGNAMGFAFDDMHDDVYVELSRFTQAMRRSWLKWYRMSCSTQCSRM